MAIHTWLGLTTDATLDSNWTNGVPDNAADDVYIPATVTTSLINFGLTRGTGTLTASGVFSDTETITLDSKVYTLQASLTDVDGNIKIGADTETTLANIKAAINLEAGAGTKYATSMTVHPSVTADSSDATTLVVTSKSAGSAGNVDSLESCANAAWTGASLGGQDGTTMNNVFIAEDFTGDVNSSGNEAPLSFNKLFHLGSGTIYIDVQAANRLIVDSPNLVLAAQVVLTSGLVSMEVTRGTATLNQNSVDGSSQRIVMSEVTSIPSKLTITGSGTIGTLRKSGGYLVLNGPTITSAVITGGRTTHQSGVITALINSSSFELESTSTQPLIEHMRGLFTTTTTAAAKTITTFWKYPGGELDYRESFDTITSLKKIGEN